MSVSLNANRVEVESYIALRGWQGCEVDESSPHQCVERPEFSKSRARMPNPGDAGSVIDLQPRPKGRMTLAADEPENILDKLPLAVAVFDSRQHLVSNNISYARLLSLPQDWLNTRPTLGEILDRLRELRLLPEQRDFAGWKKLNLKRFGDGTQNVGDFWHLPNGQPFRVVSQSRQQGGLLVSYEDVSETLALKAANQALVAVQIATLDAMDDAVAIFRPDGVKR